MTALALVTAGLAGVLYVALRTARPSGVALDPWPAVLRFDTTDRFIRNLPEPGEAICDVEPPHELLRGLAAIYPFYSGLTRCYYKPHGRRPGVAHVGMLVHRDERGRLAHEAYQWIEQPWPVRLLIERRPPRWTWWRKLLIRLATP